MLANTRIILLYTHKIVTTLLKILVWDPVVKKAPDSQHCKPGQERITKTPLILKTAILL